MAKKCKAKKLGSLNLIHPCVLPNTLNIDFTIDFKHPQVCNHTSYISSIQPSTLLRIE